MAIKNPNPNIKDFEVNDNTTWSSAHIAAGLLAAGVDVGAEGSVATSHFQLLDDETFESASSNFDLTNINCKNIFVIISFTADASVTGTFYLRYKTPEGGDAYFASPSYARASLTSGNSYIITLDGTCNNGIINGNGFISTGSSYGNVQRQNASSYFSNIIASKFTSLQIASSITMPVGTTIKIYGY